MSEFDKFGQNYHSKLGDSLRGLGTLDYALKSKYYVLQNIIESTKKESDNRILDFGCGTGLLSEVLSNFSSDVTGADVSFESLRNSVMKHKRSALFDGLRLPFRTHSFSVAVASCVFHHITPDTRTTILKEIDRVLIPGGILIIIEHNPYNPVTRFVVNRCEFDEDAVLLTMSEAQRMLAESGYHRYMSGYFYALPPLNSFFSKLDSAFSRIPAGAQYYCAYRTRQL